MRPFGVTNHFCRIPIPDTKVRDDASFMVMLQNIRDAALDARRRALIVARTDALSVEGLDAALDRAERFVEAGADLVFVEGPRTLDELQAVAARLGRRTPLVHNLVEGGVAPVTTGEALEDLAFAVALHPLVLLHGFAHKGPELLTRLKAEKKHRELSSELAGSNHGVGAFSGGEPVSTSPENALAEMNRITGVAELTEAAERYD